MQSAIGYALREERATYVQYRPVAFEKDPRVEAIGCTIYAHRSGEALSLCGVCFILSRDEDAGTADASHTQPQHATDLVERNRVMARVVHDLRNPLSTLLIRSDLMERQAHSAGTPARWMRHFTAIGRCVRTMQRLISNWEAYGAVTSGQLRFEPVTVSARSLFAQISEVGATLAAERTLLSDAELPDHDTYLRCDVPRVVDAVANLVAHAVHRTQSGDVVGVYARQTAAGLEIRVEEGSSEPTPADAVGEDDWDPGLRLDLYIAKRVIEAQGGRLHAQPARQHGICLHVTLPSVEAERVDRFIQEKNGVRPE